MHPSLKSLTRHHSDMLLSNTARHNCWLEQESSGVFDVNLARPQCLKRHYDGHAKTHKTSLLMR